MYFKPSHVTHLKEFLVFFLSWLREESWCHPLFRKINVLCEHANSCSSQPHTKWHFYAGTESLVPALRTFEREMGSLLSPRKHQSNNSISKPQPFTESQFLQPWETWCMQEKVGKNLLCIVNMISLNMAKGTVASGVRWALLQAPLPRWVLVRHRQDLAPHIQASSGTWDL